MELLLSLLRLGFPHTSSNYLPSTIPIPWLLPHQLSTRDPQLLLHKLRELHTEAEKEYGLKLFTAFLGNGGKTIETIVNSQDAAIVKVRNSILREMEQRRINGSENSSQVGSVVFVSSLLSRLRACPPQSYSNLSSSTGLDMAQDASEYHQFLA